ncbi:MAG: hypothetical protein IT434_14030 [Phycisphaerales bacterium]|nr:hypothetical protein [Phycisphaerales bacterium]
METREKHRSVGASLPIIAPMRWGVFQAASAGRLGLAQWPPGQRGLIHVWIVLVVGTGSAVARWKGPGQVSDAGGAVFCGPHFVPPWCGAPAFTGRRNRNLTGEDKDMPALQFLPIRLFARPLEILALLQAIDNLLREHGVDSWVWWVLSNILNALYESLALVSSIGALDSLYDAVANQAREVR